MVSSAAPDRILILEDEPALVEVLGAYLRAEGYIVSEDFVGLAGPARALRERSSLVILDLNLPKLHGSEVYRRMREVYDVPIIVLSPSVNETDRLAGFELGADDSIAKPFSPRDVVARVKSVLARMGHDGERTLSRRGIQIVGALEIDRMAHEVRRRGIPVLLTPTNSHPRDAGRASRSSSHA